MKLDGPTPAEEPLIRGNSELIRGGDFVAYGGFDGGEPKPTFKVSANRIRRIFKERGTRFFEIQGTGSPGFSGGPLFGGGKTILGIILNVKPLDDKTAVFYVADVTDIPPLSPSRK
jgi:hypothetical protein